jgi:hypothetical protein
MIQTYRKNRETEMDKTSNSPDTNWKTSKVKIKHRGLRTFLGGGWKAQELSTELRKGKNSGKGGGKL